MAFLDVTVAVAIASRERVLPNAVFGAITLNSGPEAHYRQLHRPQCFRLAPPHCLCSCCCRRRPGGYQSLQVAERRFFALLELIVVKTGYRPD